MGPCFYQEKSIPIWNYLKYTTASGHASATAAVSKT